MIYGPSGGVGPRQCSGIFCYELCCGAGQYAELLVAVTIEVIIFLHKGSDDLRLPVVRVPIVDGREGFRERPSTE